MRRERKGKGRGRDGVGRKKERNGMEKGVVM